MEHSALRRLRNVIISALSNPYNLIAISLIITLGYLIVYPIVDMTISTFRVAQGDLRRIPGSQVGDFTLFHWTRLFFSQVSSALLFTPLRNSIIVGASVTVLSIAFGFSMAWLMVRSDLPLKKIFWLLLLVPYMLPSWTIAMMWMTIFRTGYMGGPPGFLAWLGFSLPDWVAYGKLPIIIVLSTSNFAFSYLLVSGAFLSVNSEMEEMASIMGASRLRIMRKVTFPLVLPALLSAAILTFSRALGAFSTPALLGMRVDYHTISTMLYFSIRIRDHNAGFAITLILIFIVSIAVYMHQKLLGVRRGYAAHGGKGKSAALVPLNKWKYPILVLLIVFMAFAVIFPLAILLLDTVMLIPGRYELSNFTLHYWIGEFGTAAIFRGMEGVLRNPWFWDSLRTTMILTLVVSTIGMVSGQLIGYITSRGRGRLTGEILNHMAFLPYMIPSITLGALYLSMWAQPRLLMPSLYGTFALLVLICVVDNLPFSSRAGTSNMMTIGYELEEAASIAGASFFRRFRRIVLPLARPGFLTGFILIFISVIRDLDLIILLMSPGTTTLSYMVFTFSNSGYDVHANVLSAIVFFIVFAAFIIAGKVGKVDLTAGYGSATDGGGER
ncbi:MAG: iron ABC transporter permease [Oscillospiraceae bacterium]|nr:iron ABC transporter permease [Oscillospiraceae bacterium]